MSRARKVAETHTVAEGAVIPIIEESVVVGKRQTERGRVTIEKHVDESDQVVETPRSRDEVSVERVPMHKVVKVAPKVRTRGRTTIIPVVEEEVVVTTRLVLKEEIHVTKVTIEEAVSKTVRLRKEGVSVRRSEPEQS